MALEKPRQTLIVTLASVMVALVTVVVTVVYFVSGSYTTSWGEKLSRGEEYLRIEGQTLTQEDLEHIAGLRRLWSLELVNCNVAECRLPEIEFASRELYHINLSGTKGLWDLSFLSKTKAEYLDLSGCPGVDNIDWVNTEEIFELDVSNTEVSDLSPISGSEVRRLKFAHTNVSDLSPLADCAELWEVDGSYTQVSSLEPLLSKEYFYDLIFEGCPIRSIDGTFANGSLRTVNLAQTQVKRLDCLAGCTNLQELRLGGCTRLSDFSWFDRSCCQTLKTLDVANTRFTAEDLKWLGDCSNLETLVLDGLPLGTLDLCRGLDKLTSLSALGCGLTDVSGIKGCTQLETILLGFNELESIEGLPSPLPDWPQTVLDLSHNKLTSMQGLPAGSYRALLLQGNGEDAVRTIPPDVETYDIVTDWFSGIDDSRLRDYDKFSMIYMLGAPADEVEGLLETFMSWHLACVSEEELLQLLEDDGFDYALHVDMSNYVARAREAQSAE